jgi:hypothetical protein
MRQIWAIALLSLFAVTALAGENGLRVRLTLESSNALVGIPTGSEIILENPTKSALPVPRHAYYRLHHLTSDEWTIARSMNGPHAVDLRDAAPAVIGPGQTVRMADLPSLALFSTIVGGSAFLRPGTYMVDVMLSDSELRVPPDSEPQYAPQVAALSTALVAPAVPFTVEEPRGDDALVWARIAEVTRNGKMPFGSIQSPGEWIRPLVIEYPESAYVPYLSDGYALDNRASAAFTAKWLARELPASVKEWLSLRRARALSKLTYENRADAASRASEDEALSIVTQLAKHATVPGMRDEAQRMVNTIVSRRTPAKDTDGD